MTRQPTPADAVAALVERLRDVLPSFNLEPEAVFVGAELAHLDPGASDARRAALVLLAVATLHATREGSTRFPVSGPSGDAWLKTFFDRLREGGAFEGLDPAFEARARAAIDALLRPGAAPGIIGHDPDDYVPLIHRPPYLYMQRMERAEARLAASIARRLPSSDAAGLAAPPPSLERAIADVEARPAFRGAHPVRLTAEQLDAVRTAARAPLALVSGGPGTGKTATVASLLRVLVRMGVDPKAIALAAPTGKAAWRMRESILGTLRAIRDAGPEDRALLDAAPEARTLHRLLGYAPRADRFRHHRGNPLGERVVIVDESSMIDLELMGALVDAVADDARLVLLGDADQLPSVAAGAVFRDLCGCPAVPGVRLTRSHRMSEDDPDGRRVLQAARAIHAGEVPDLSTRRTPAEIAYRGVELLPVERDLGPWLEAWYTQHLAPSRDLADRLHRPFTRDAEGAFAAADRGPLDALFARLASVRVLCVTRVFPTGTIALNDALHRLAQTHLPRAHRSSRFLIGEPVLVRANDYDRHLFNGDQGVVLVVRDPGRRPTPMAVFPRDRGYAAFPLDTLEPHLERAWALTVHKSQGSEFDAVAVVLPHDDLPLLTRELLYTAITRARKAVLLVGDPARLTTAAANPVQRFCGLADRLTHLAN